MAAMSRHCIVCHFVGWIFDAPASYIKLWLIIPDCIQEEIKCHDFAVDNIHTIMHLMAAHTWHYMVSVRLSRDALSIVSAIPPGRMQ